MNNLKTLIAYASKHGSTAEIAKAIHEVLNKSGITTVISAARDVIDLKAYGAVVLGSAIYMDNWQKDAIHFVKRFKNELSERPVWLFQAGPFEDLAVIPGKPLAARSAALLHTLNIRGFITFGGKLTKETSGLIERIMVNKGMSGDFRDFDRIRAWADTIAGELLPNRKIN